MTFNTRIILLFQNIAYGRNDQTLDLYLPGSEKLPTNVPIVMFLYGGAWGSGDKSMYGLLCSKLAKHMNVIVCCPNYSTYPQVIDPNNLTYPQVKYPNHSTYPQVKYHYHATFAQVKHPTGTGNHSCI